MADNQQMGIGSFMQEQMHGTPANEDEEQRRRAAGGTTPAGGRQVQATTTSVVDPRPAGQRMLDSSGPALSSPPTQAGGGPTLSALGSPATTLLPPAEEENTTTQHTTPPSGGIVTQPPAGTVNPIMPVVPQIPQVPTPGGGGTTQIPDDGGVQDVPDGMLPGGGGDGGGPTDQEGQPPPETVTTTQPMPDWYDQLWALTQDRPEFQSIGAEMPELTENLMGGAGGLAQEMLDNPSRYDTDLFNQLLSSGLGQLDQSQERDRLDLMRSSMSRLGPQAGQLSNEYIDLADEYDTGRNNLMLSLAREAATTQSQDRLAALSGARGVAGDAFDQNQSIRNEERGERAAGQQDRLSELGEMAEFGGIDRQLGRDAQDDYFRHITTEMGLNESQARLMQNEFANSLALSQLFANMPAGVGGTPEPEGGGGNSENPEMPQNTAEEEQYNAFQEWAKTSGMPQAQIDYLLETGGWRNYDV